ncbi:hypothetical protein EfmJHP38_11700 [Enterococcus faecium]|nr:hypothetical protein EfmJHP38_11700 [Enterococcus faecium]
MYFFVIKTTSELFSSDYDVLDTLDNVLSDYKYMGKSVVAYVWGNHTDPYGYLSQMGVSKEKLAYDLAHGFTDENPTTSENKCF